MMNLTRHILKITVAAVILTGICIMNVSAKNGLTPSQSISKEEFRILNNKANYNSENKINSKSIDNIVKIYISDFFDEDFIPFSVKDIFFNSKPYYISKQSEDLLYEINNEGKVEVKYKYKCDKSFITDIIDKKSIDIGDNEMATINDCYYIDIKNYNGVLVYYSTDKGDIYQVFTNRSLKCKNYILTEYQLSLFVDKFYEVLNTDDKMIFKKSYICFDFDPVKAEAEAKNRISSSNNSDYKAVADYSFLNISIPIISLLTLFISGIAIIKTNK